jgi:8-amino-7-oxononanoate synthase
VRGPVLDFTSALYLGLRHPSWAVEPWGRLTEGAPAALRESLDSRRTATTLALLIGTEGTTLMPSTLHAFWDLFGTLASRTTSIYVDAGTYPVGWWGAERAGTRGAAVHSFRHHDAESLELAMVTKNRGETCVIVTDGWCPGCGGPAPLRDYLDVARRHRGRLVVDDTQAMGVLGSRPATYRPFGSEGGGSLRWHGLEGPEVMVVASLAKGFGVPMTVMGGSRSALSAFESRSQTRVHLSPVSMAHVRAAQHAMRINARFGPSLRRRLGATIARFRVGMAGLGLAPTGGMFPVQSITPGPGLDPIELHRRLLGRGIRSVVIRPLCRPGPALAFLLTARHTAREVDATISALAGSLSSPRSSRAPWVVPRKRPVDRSFVAARSAR